jgi:HEAT repeat protein
MLAASAGVKALPALADYWGSDDVTDRRELVDAVVTLGSSKAIDLLALALADPDIAVEMRAAAGLGTIGNRRAIALLTGSIEHGDWLLVQAVLKQLAPLHARSAGPALAARILRDLQEPVVDGGLRSNLQRALDALVELRYSDAAELLSEAGERQPDHGLVQALRSAATRLQTLAENGTAVPMWAELASGPDAEMRALARSRLAEIGSAPAVSALESSFDTVPARERREVLEALGEAGSDRAAGVLERVLTSPEFATAEALPDREWAAWAASRIGGRKMFELLTRAVESRNGRDSKVTAYAALAGGEQAIPLLRAYRAIQMQYVGWNRGRAQERLNWVLGQLERGRAIDVLDLPPPRLSLMP